MLVEPNVQSMEHINRYLLSQYSDCYFFGGRPYTVCDRLCVRAVQAAQSAWTTKYFGVGAFYRLTSTLFTSLSSYRIYMSPDVCLHPLESASVRIFRTATGRAPRVPFLAFPVMLSLRQ